MSELELCEKYFSILKDSDSLRSRLQADALQYVRERFKRWPIPCDDPALSRLSAVVALCCFLHRAGLKPRIQTGTLSCTFGRRGSRSEVEVGKGDLLGASQNGSASLVLKGVHIWIYEDVFSLIWDPSVRYFCRIEIDRLDSPEAALREIAADFPECFVGSPEADTQFGCWNCVYSADDRYLSDFGRQIQSELCWLRELLPVFSNSLENLKDYFDGTKSS